MSPRARDRAEPHSKGRHARLWLWAVALGLAVLYLGESFLARGVYNDDDIGHYLMARDAPRDPALYLNVWGRPLFTLVYSLPAQFGFDAVRRSTALVTVATAIVTGLGGTRLGVPAPLGAALFGTMPFVLLLSYSSLTEPLAALVIAASLWAWLARRRGLALCGLGLLPLARLELAVLAIPLGLLAAAQLRGWRRLYGLLPGAFLVLWAAIGAMATGDLAWLPHQVLGEGENLYGQTGFWHYPQGLIHVVGPVVFLFLLVDLGERIRARRVDLVALLPASVLGLYIVFSWKLSVGHAAGFLRHLVAASPAFALSAARGLESALHDSRARRGALAILAAGTVVIGVFHSRALVMHHRAVGPFELSRLMVGILVLVLATLAAARRPRLPAGALASGIVLLALGYAIAAEPPLSPSAEQEAVLALAAQFLGSADAGSPVIASHPWFLLALDRAGRLPPGGVPLTKRPAIESAAPGTVIIWDSHYALRPPDGMTLRDFKFDPRFELVRESIASDRRFGAYVLRKTRS
jgi:hypothetical protein